MRVILLLVVACALFAADQAKPAATPIVPGVHYADNLARIPVADPVATQVPELLAAMRGQHPRLLFTRPEVDELRKRIASDPMLQKTAEATVAWAKRFRMSKEDPPNIVMSDTPALANSGAKTPALALAYLLDRDPKIKGAIVSMLNAMLAQPYWANAADSTATWEPATTC